MAPGLWTKKPEDLKLYQRSVEANLVANIEFDLLIFNVNLLGHLSHLFII